MKFTELKKLSIGFFTALILVGSIFPLRTFADTSFVGLVYTCQHGPILNPSNPNNPNETTDTSGDESVEPEHECDFTDFINAVKHLMDYAFVLSIPIAIIAFTWAGVKLLLSQGNPGKINEAKKIFMSVLIGFAFILAAWLIVYTIAKGLGCTDCLQFLQQ